MLSTENLKDAGQFKQLRLVPNLGKSTYGTATRSEVDAQVASFRELAKRHGLKQLSEGKFQANVKAAARHARVSV